MVREKFESYFFQMAKNAFKLSTIVGENFEIYFCQMAKMYLNCPPWLENIFQI